MSYRTFNRKSSFFCLGRASAHASLILAMVLALAGAGRADGPKTAEDWFKRANEMYQEGAVDEAIGSLQEAIKLKPDYAEALNLLGAAYVESGEFAKAVEPYKKASELKPNDYSILLGYSNALEGAGRQDDELPVVKKLFNLNKGDMVTGIKFLTLIEAAGREKYVNDYIAVLEDLRKLPNFDPAYTAKLARAYNKTGDYAKAAGVYQELVKDHPDNGEYWTGLANAQAKIDPDAARESYKKAILYTDRADDRAKLEKSMAALGKGAGKTAAATPAPAAAPAQPAATAAPAATPAKPAAPPVAAAPSAPSAAEKAKAEADAQAAAKAQVAADAAAAKKAAEAKADADKAAKAQAIANAAAAEADKAAMAKARQDSIAQSQAEKKAAAEVKAAAERQAKDEVARLAKARQDSIAQAQAEKKANADAEAAAAKKAAAVKAEAKAESDRLAKEDAARLAKAKQDSIAQAKASAEADKTAKAEAARLAKEEAARVAKARQDSLAQAQAEKKAAVEAAAKTKAESDRLAKEEAARLAKAKQDSTAQAKAAADADRQAKAEAARLAKEETARLAKARQDSIAQTQAEKKAAAEADRQAKAEALRLAKEETARLAKARADSIAQVKAERIAQAKADSSAKAEASRLAKEEKARLAKVRADSIAQVQAEKKAALEANRQAKLEAARLAKEEAARLAKARADSIAQVQAEKKAALEAARVAKLQADSLAREEAKARAKAKADSVAQVLAEKKAALEAARVAKLQADSLAREEARVRAKAKADSIAQALAEKKAAAEAARIAKVKADSVAREEAKVRAQARADSLAKVEAERKAAREEAARLAKEEADRRAKERLDSLARVEADRKAKAEAERVAKEEAAKLAKEEAERRAKAKADSLAKVEEDRRLAAEAEKQFQGQVTALLAEQPAQLDTAAVLAKLQDRIARAKTSDSRLVEAEATIHFKQWNFRGVVDDFHKQKVLSANGNRMMALSLFELQDYKASLGYFRKMPNVSANRADWGKYIKTLLETKNKTLAVGQYEQYLAKYPDADDALAFLIDYYRQPLQKDKLIPKLELQLAKSPKDVALLSELISLYDKNSPKSIEYRERLLKENPEDSKQALALAQAYEAKGAVAQALPLYQKLAKDAPTDKAVNLKAGEISLQAKKPDEALPFLEAAHTADPADKKLTLRLAALYEDSKQQDKAAELYSAVMGVDPKDKAVQAKLLQLYTAKGDKEQIRGLLMRIDDADATAHQAQFQLAKTFLADGDKDKAYAYLAKALRNQPNNQEYLALLPSVVQSDDQVDAHFAALEKSAFLPGAKPELQAMVARGFGKRKNNLMSARLYAEAYSKDPKVLDGKREAVVSVYEAKNLELAGALAEKYLATDDKDRQIREIEVNSFTATNKPADKVREAIKGLAALDAEGAAKWSMKLAQLDLQAQDTASAIEHAKEWLNRNPKDAAGWRFLAPLVVKRAGQEETQIQVLEKLSQLEPANKGRYDLALGDLYLGKGDFESAEKAMSSATKASPANAALFFKLGEVETKLRKDKDAAAAYQRAYMLDRTNVQYARAYSASVDTKDEIKINLPLFQLLSKNGPSGDERKKLAQAYFLNADYANAAKEFEALLPADPDLAVKEPMVADAYMKSGQASKARALYEARLKDDPSNLQLLETVANIYKAEGNNQGYVTTVEKIVAADPKYKNYQLTLAQEREKSKDYKGALDQYSAWVSRNGGDLASVKAMHRLATQTGDTAALMDALVRLNREKVVDPAYRFQLAELDYKRSGNVGGVERLVKTHPEWKVGKGILVKEYLRTHAMPKLVPLQGFLLAESKTNKELLEPLADLYAMQKKTLQANIAYHDLLLAYPKDRETYTKVVKYSEANKSPYLPDVYRIGYEAFPDDMDVKRSYAATLGNTPKALAIYQEILEKETDVKIISKALGIALALNQTQAAAALLDKWTNVEPKEPKVWQQALAVHTQMHNVPRMIEDLEQLSRFFPNNKDYPLQLARLYEDGKQPDKAADMYQKALALDPKNKAVQNKLISLFTAQNRQPELRDLLLSIDKNDPTAHEAQYMLAKMFLADNDRDRAYVYATKALRNQPNNQLYLSLLPQTVITDEQVMANFPALEKFALLPGAKPELQVLVARGYAKKKNWIFANRLFADAYAKNPKLLDGNRDAVIAMSEAKNWPMAGKLADAYLQGAPSAPATPPGGATGNPPANAPVNAPGTDKDLVIQQIRYNAYVATAQPPEKLREALKGLVAVDPDANKYYLRLAQLDLAAHDTSVAVAHAREYLAKNPKETAGWKFLLPLVAKKPGQEDIYIQTLEKLVVLDPGMRARYDLELGNLYFEKGDFEGAEKSLSSAVKTSPANASLWFKLGETLVKLRKDKEAADKYARAYHLEPNNLTYARAYVRSVDTRDEIKANLPLFKTLAANGPSVDERKKLGMAYYLNGDYANAAKEFDWQLQGDPTVGTTDPMYADAYMKTGQTKKAQGLYEQRLATDPNNLPILETLAGIYKASGDQKDYVATVEKIVAVNPKYKGYQLILAVEKEKAKDYKGALQEYSEWVTRNAEDETALKSMHRLAEMQKDTAALMDALVRLTRKKGADPVYSFQMAEVDYVRSGNFTGIERLVKTHPTYTHGKIILIKAYYKKGAYSKMVPFLPFLSAQAKTDKSLSEPLADLYASMKKSGPANEAYFDAVHFDKKDRDLFDKAYKYAKDHDSPYRPALLKQGYEQFPDDGQLKFDYALTLGKTPKALDLYNEILQKDHNNLAVVRNAAEVSVALFKQADAIDHLTHWATLEPEQPRPWSLLVDIYTQQRNDTKLADALEHLSALSPKNGDLAFKAALADKKIGNKEKSLELLTKAVALNGTNPLYQKEFGLALFAAGQTARAKAPLLIADKSLKNDESINTALYNIYVAEKNKGLARERLRFLFALRPANKEYAYGLARLESDLKNPAGAVSILERPNLKDDLNADMSFLLLDGYFKLGQRDRAAALGPVLIRKFPEEAKQSLPLAILFYETKQRAKAKEILETYVRNTPSEEAFYYLGKCYYDEKNWEQAINSLDRADLNRADVLRMLGESYIANKEPQRAIKAYEDYYAKTKDIKVLAELYTLYKRTQDTEGTRAILERLIAAEPGNYDYRVELAELYRGKGDTKKAEAQYEMILKKIPNHPASNMNYGMILAARKDYAKATHMLETGLAKFPDSAMGWRYLGDAYRSEKRYPAALVAYKKAYKLQPNSLPLAVAKMQMTKEAGSSDELPGAYADVVRLDSSNVEAAAALADIRFNDRKYADAAALYAKVTSVKGNDKNLWANYGNALIETKDIEGAKRALQRAVDLGEKSPKVMTSLARIYKEEGNSEKAEAILSEMVKKDPRNHLAYYWLGQIALERNQPGVAEDYLKKAQVLAPTNPDYVEALARMQYGKDEFASAAKLLEPVKANLSTPGHLMYGDCLMKQGKNEAALAEINAVFVKDPSAPVLAKLAELQINKGNDREAIRLIEASDFKGDTTVQFALAKARVDSRETDRAREILDRLIKMNKYNAGYWHYRGLSYYYDHNYGKAKKDFDQALDINQDYMDAVYHIGLCLLKDGSSTDAKNYFKELSQHANASWQAKGFLGLAMAFEAERKYEAAENFLQKSNAAEENPEALSLLAKVLLKLRKPSEAEKNARRALELQPGNSVAVAAMGDVLLAQNRKPEAVSLVKKALEGNPNSCDLLIGSAKVNFAAGNYETSKQNSTYAISICPEEASPYYYAGVVADKKYDKKQAKDYFKAFKKHGGDEGMLPADYR